MIPQNKIDEAVKEHFFEKQLDYDIAFAHKDTFSSGVKFALNEIQPLMVEFAKWYINNTVKAEVPNMRRIKGQYSSCYTTEQLLEEFINNKNNQK